MNTIEMMGLSEITIAPWIYKAQPLIYKKRIIGGNMFRHQIGTFGVLLDYSMIKGTLLKASVIHDLFEEYPGIDISDLRDVDHEYNDVIDIVMEVTKKENENKNVFLERILKVGSDEAKILKAADRIDNLIQINRDIFNTVFIKRYIQETQDFVMPGIESINKDMCIELNDLIIKLKKLL